MAQRGDTLTVRCITAAQVAWLACLAMLWAWAFDASGEGMLLTMTAMLLAGATVAAASGLLARWARWALTQAGLSQGETLSMVLGESRRRAGVEGQALVRLFVAAALAAVAGSVLAMAAVFLSVKLTGVLTRHFLWTPVAWVALKVIIQWAGFLPAAGGAMAVFAAAGLIRRDSSSDPMADALGRWLRAIAAGLAIFAAAWALGADLLIFAMACGGVIAAAAGLVWWCGKAAMMESVEPNQALPSGGRRNLLATFAGLSLVLVIQVRLGGEMFGVGMVGRCLWVVGSLSMLAVMIARADRKDGPTEAHESMGVVIGVVAVVGGQMALATVALVDHGLLAFGLLAWLALQAPVVMLSARLISHQRRAWVASGGGGQGYISIASAGAAAGIVLQLVGGLSPLGWLIPTIALVWVIVAAAACAAKTDRPDAQTQWIAWALVLLGATVLSVAAPMHQLGPARRGTWLSMVGEGPPTVRLFRPRGSLPYARTWRGEGVTAAMAEVLAGEEERYARRGRWWVVSTSDRDVPDVLGIYPARSSPDPMALPSSVRRRTLLQGSEGNYLAAGQIGHGVFDGLLLAPLPADHPDAWRCYNVRTIRRCIGRVHPDGVILLRTQASAEDVGDLMAVAATFTEAVGPSWAVVEFGDGVIDMLLVGPREIGGEEAIARPSGSETVYVFPAELFQDGRTHIKPLRVLNPPGLLQGRVLRPGRLPTYLQTISSAQQE